MKKELVMYSRTLGCPYITIAKKFLGDYQVPYREIFIDQDPTARENVLQWTGFLSVPTLVAAAENQILPYEEPTFLKKGASPRGINRGSMITEPNAKELERWLQQHGFLEVESSH